MSQADTALSEIRDQIDDIDRQMQGLLIQRAALADEVSAIKAGSSVNIRPSREADILRRLVSRHQGPFSKKSLVRIWREIFSAMLRLEGSFSVALYQPDDLPGYWDMARDQYGTYTPLQAHHSPRRVIESVMRDDATLGVLPYPSGEDEDPWWRTLAAGANTASRQDSPKVVAKFPFAGTSSSRTRGIEPWSSPSWNLNPRARIARCSPLKSTTTLAPHDSRAASPRPVSRPGWSPNGTIQRSGRAGSTSWNVLNSCRWTTLGWIIWRRRWAIRSIKLRLSAVTRSP